MARKRKRSKPLTVAEMAKLGGKARMAKLSPEERAKLGRQAAGARWAQEKAKNKE